MSKTAILADGALMQIRGKESLDAVALVIMYVVDDPAPAAGVRNVTTKSP